MTSPTLSGSRAHGKARQSWTRFVQTKWAVSHFKQFNGASRVRSSKCSLRQEAASNCKESAFFYLRSYLVMRLRAPLGWPRPGVAPPVEHAHTHRVDTLVAPSPATYAMMLDGLEVVAGDHKHGRRWTLDGGRRSFSDLARSDRRLL
jgi:hypothetical protein